MLQNKSSFLDFRKLASNWTGHLVNNNRPRAERVLFEFARQYITVDPQLNCFELNRVFLDPKTVQFKILLYFFKILWGCHETYHQVKCRWKNKHNFWAFHQQIFYITFVTFKCIQIIGKGMWAFSLVRIFVRTEHIVSWIEMKSSTKFPLNF